jgi:1-acyl-sn-glycerol-3-phosphate acyltransferase
VSFARSVLFAIALIIVTPPYALIALASAPLPRMVRYRIISGWSRLILLLSRFILGIEWRVEGRENLPSRPAVILAKHQSAWETLAFQHIFPPQVHVLKRELLWIPFFGWGLALMSPIAIDRRRGHSALRFMAKRGQQRLDQGFWVVVFPEGTRVAPVVPVAHNAGHCWPRNAFLKRPGTVTVRIGPAIEPGSRKPQEINALAKEWIEQQQKVLA